MDKINYNLVPVSTEFTGGAKVYRASVQTNGTMSAEEFASKLAETTSTSESRAQLALTSFATALKELLVEGCRANAGQLSVGLAIKGAFDDDEDRFDAERHSVVPTMRTLSPLRNAMSGVDPQNIVVSLVCSVISLMDAVTKETNAITGSNEVHIQGTSLGINTENADEGVTLVDDDGNVKATATVTDSTPQVVTCKFLTPPAAGTYTLVVSCRNGNRETLAPAVGKLKNVTVKANA